MSTTAAERIYSDLKDNIVRAYYATNEFLVERAIAETYGVSKTPVREALRRLCQEGYLVSYARKGYLVNRAKGGEHIQIQQLRFFIESGCIRYIVKNSSAEQIRRLRGLLSDDQADGSAGATNAGFHLAMVRLVDNPYLVDTEERLLGLLHGMLPQIMLLNRGLNLTESHEDIVSSLERRDEAAAIDALRRDLTLSEYDT